MLTFEKSLAEDHSKNLRTIKQFLSSKNYPKGLEFTRNIEKQLGNSSSTFYQARIAFFKAIFLNRTNDYQGCLDAVIAIQKMNYSHEFIIQREWNFLFYIQACSQVKLKNSSLALETLGKISQDNSDVYVRAKLLSATLLLKEGRMEIVIDILTNLKITKNIEFEIEYHMMLGIAYFHQKRINLSFDHLTKAVSLMQDNNSTLKTNLNLKINALTILAEIYIDSCNYEEALNILNFCNNFNDYLSTENQFDHIFQILYLKIKCYDGQNNVSEITQTIELFAQKMNLAPSPRLDIMYAQILLFGIYHLLNTKLPTYDIKDMLNNACFFKSHIPALLRNERDVAESVYHFKLGSPWGYYAAIELISAQYKKASESEQYVLSSIHKKWVGLVAETPSEDFSSVSTPFTARYSTSRTLKLNLSPSPTVPTKKDFHP